MRIDHSLEEKSLRTNSIAFARYEPNGAVAGLQKQITRIQEQLRKLAENEEISAESKMDKRKELLDQMQELNKQLTLARLEKLKEERNNLTSAENSIIEGDDSDSFERLGTPAMQSIISAYAAYSQVKTAQSVKTRAKGEAGRLAIEIKTDSERGVNTAAKKEQLKKAEETIQNTDKHLSEVIIGIRRDLDEANHTETAGVNTEHKDDTANNRRDTGNLNNEIVI